MVCGACGHLNEASARYCSSCGAALEPPAGGDITVDIPTVPDVPRGGAVLHVARGPNAGSNFVVDGDVTSIGRHPDSAVFLDDITVSRRHAAVRRIGGAYEVSDVGSLNGTYVDHKRVDTAPLHHLADLQIGRFVLVFLVGSEET